MAYPRRAMDDARPRDEVWLLPEPTPHLRAEPTVGETGTPPDVLPCDPARLEYLIAHGLIHHRPGNRDRLSITPLGRQTLERAG